ncbi:hypothetical protein M406DRAFT_322056 [Cryphonectria parasitica EP155]|uniref:Rhodopsin domain-containing protein n=1 Tax=Cryphonectria parasitica (strain ATCC 38755 / EP155) TaxID=660469 RepID=A0A9P5CQ01_CRYP1|nr:uncharacterized protein M406DRAFT_322056 [Cryphonectria parasitica EP155]KAF3765726.1 hypothetical protein M406DRAFT_322056 [Cryphonectria parasitica EP155]
MHWMQAAAAFSVAVDLWYAAMPWYLLHRLTRPRREKYLVQGSMSLGVIAAGCGIARALSIYPAATNADAKSAAILYLWHGAEMAVTMICIGMPVCRPAVSSMLQALGIRVHSFRTTKEHNSNHTGSKYHQQSSSYIRNFGANATWEEAVGATDVDSWSQRRILGVGDTTSGATGGVHGGVTATPGANGVGGGAGGGKEAGGDGLAGSRRESIITAGGKEFELGYPMRTMSKSGITVTKTVDITNGRKNSR